MQTFKEYKSPTIEEDNFFYLEVNFCFLFVSKSKSILLYIFLFLYLFSSAIECKFFIISKILKKADNISSCLMLVIMVISSLIYLAKVIA